MEECKTLLDGCSIWSEIRQKSKPKAYSITPEKFCKVEDQIEIWQQAETLGKEIAESLKKMQLM